MSEFHFLRSFKRTYGMTPHEYLTELRISHAKRLLETSDDTLFKITTSLGFESASTFSTLFKRATGLSPRSIVSASETALSHASFNPRRSFPDAFYRTMVPALASKI